MLLYPRRRIADFVPGEDVARNATECRKLRLTDVSKRYETRNGMVTIFEGVSLQVNYGEKLGILGRNGAGKSTIIRLISGAELPSSGKVDRSMSVSWPLAFGGAFQGALTGLDNLRFISRIYGRSVGDRIGFVEDFCELGTYFREPVKTYSAGMRARLAFAISMVVDFDCFLIDEIVAVGDARFTEKCRQELFEKRGDRAMIIVSHDREFIRGHCDRAAVLSGGRLHQFDTVEQAYDFYGQHFN
jgi:capsular polysaccharide transport system ATP-binding protein